MARRRGNWKLTDEQRRLADENARFALWAARRFEARVDLDWHDLVSACQFGLIRAARSFDPSRGVKFISYAWHAIRSDVQQAVRKRMRRSREFTELADYPLRDLIPAPTVGDPLERAESHEQVCSGLSELPEKERVVVTLRYFEDLTRTDERDALTRVRSSSHRSVVTHRL